MSTLSKIFDLQKDFNSSADELNELINSLYHVGQENLADRIYSIKREMVNSNDRIVNAVRDKNQTDFDDVQKTIGTTLNAMCGAINDRV